MGRDNALYVSQEVAGEISNERMKETTSYNDDGCAISFSDSCVASWVRRP